MSKFQTQFLDEVGTALVVFQGMSYRAYFNSSSFFFFFFFF